MYQVERISYEISFCTRLQLETCFFFLIRIVRSGVRTGSTRHVGHWMAYCTCPGWLWWWRIWWNEDWQGKPKYSEKTWPNSTLSTTNPTWPDTGSNPGRRDGKPATKRSSYGAASTYFLLIYLIPSSYTLRCRGCFFFSSCSFYRR
jgi:hypothetical protein